MRPTYIEFKATGFYDGHRTAVDCHAAIELLSKPLPRSSKLALQAFLEEVRSSTCRITERRNGAVRSNRRQRGSWRRISVTGRRECALAAQI